MADLFKTQARKARVFAGSWGNDSVSLPKRTLAAAAINDKVYLGIIPAESKLHTVELVHGALGASTTLALGWENVDGTAGGGATEFLAAAASASAGRRAYTGFPLETTKDIYVYATVAGAVATGDVQLVAQYEYIGTE